MEPTFHSAEWNTQYFANLLVWKLVIVCQAQNFPELGRHLIDDTPKKPALLFELQPVVGRDVVGFQQVREPLANLVLTADLGLERDLTTPGLASELVARLVGRDGEKPGLQLAARVERLRREVKLNEGVLHDVLSRGGTVRESKDELEKLAMMPRNDLPEGGVIAVQVPSQQLFIRWRAHPSIVSLRPRRDVV